MELPYIIGFAMLVVFIIAMIVLLVKDCLKEWKEDKRTKNSN